MAPVDTQIHALREAVARLRVLLEEFDRELESIEPDRKQKLVLTPEVSELLETIVPEDERERLTEILPQLAHDDDPRRQS